MSTVSLRRVDRRETGLTCKPGLLERWVTERAALLPHEVERLDVSRRPPKQQLHEDRGCVKRIT